MSRAGGSGRHSDGIRDHPVIDGRKLLAFPGRMRLAERMRIERWDPGDTATAMACYEVFLAAHTADEPIEPSASTGTVYTLLANGVPDAAALVVKGAIIAGAVWSQQKGKNA